MIRNLLIIARELAQHVEETIYDELSQIYARLKKEQQARADAGLLSPRANRTILETRLVVEAKRSIDVTQIASNVCGIPWCSCFLFL